jgi:hypothetical protein
MIGGILLILTHKRYFANLFPSLSFINKANRNEKINRMHLMSLNMLSESIQVLNSIRKHPTKNECFPKHILFTTFLLKQKLKHRNYFEHAIINMRNFV